MKTFYTDNQTYVGATPAELVKIEPSLAQGQGGTLTITTPTATGYVIDVDSKTGNDFFITEANGTVTRTCTTVAKAGCPSSGTW
jgi:NADPH-dependent curcumin reductase CurA